MSLITTAAAGLQSQQARMDALANNIANQNTPGYQSSDVSFADTLTEFYGQSPAVTGLTRQTPTGFELGTGAYALNPQANFAAGNYTTTTNPLDMAIQGDGFFTVGLGNKQTGYTRAGDFVASVGGQGQMYLTTPDGHAVLGTNGQPINLTGVNLSTLQVSPDGTLTADGTNGQPVNLGKLGLAYVNQPQFALTPQSGQLYTLKTGYTAVTNATPGVNSTQLMGQVQGKMLEGSNVNLTQVMSQMVATQNDNMLASKAVNMANQMMTVANLIPG